MPVTPTGSLLRRDACRILDRHFLNDHAVRLFGDFYSAKGCHVVINERGAVITVNNHPHDAKPKAPILAFVLAIAGGLFVAAIVVAVMLLRHPRPTDRPNPTPSPSSSPSSQHQKR